jgi:hypothetical protein
VANDADAVEARLEKEKRFDPDIWVVEVEAEQPAMSELISLEQPSP